METYRILTRPLEHDERLAALFWLQENNIQDAWMGDFSIKQSYTYLSYNRIKYPAKVFFEFSNIDDAILFQMMWS